MSLFMPHQRLALAFLWLIVFSRVGIAVHDGLGPLAMWAYILACFGYAYDLHVSLPPRLRRLWQGLRFRPGIARA